MSDQFVAEIRIVGFNFAPTGWAFCNGQILPLSQNTALFSLLGTTYGGNGKSNFALPDLQGRVPMHPGQGPGLSLHDLGEEGGVETVTLLQSEIPAHNHNYQARPTALAAGQKDTPVSNYPGRSNSRPYNSGPPNQLMGALGTYPTGGDFPHNNMQPYLTMNFIIALQGIFPPRN
ncbi:MAG: phage tail protein [Acidobacteria bacterium]|nr:phage tail protein [Acidobacteriota bacterium]